MAVRERVRCTLCGWDVAPTRFGLAGDGHYDPAEAPQHELSVRFDTFAGRANISVTREPLPLPYAIGMRDALRAALGRVEAEIAAAGGAEES